MNAIKGNRLHNLDNHTSNNGLLQRKLQRAYQEKETLSAEVASKKVQLQIAKSNATSAMQAVVQVQPGHDQTAWTHLLDQHMRSGTLACIMCIKTHLIKSLARAYNRWKYLCGSTFLNATPGDIGLIHGAQGSDDHTRDDSGVSSLQLGADGSSGRRSHLRK